MKRKNRDRKKLLEVLIKAENAEHLGLRFPISFSQMRDELAAKVLNYFKIKKILELFTLNTHILRYEHHN